MVSSGYSTLINHRILDYPILGKHPDQPRYLIHEIHDWNNYPMKPFWPKKRFQIADANSDPFWSAYHLPMFVARNRTLWSRAMTSASQRLDRGDHDGPGFVPKPNDRSVRETTPVSRVPFTIQRLCNLPREMGSFSRKIILQSLVGVQTHFWPGVSQHEIGASDVNRCK